MQACSRRLMFCAISIFLPFAAGAQQLPDAPGFALTEVQPDGDVYSCSTAYPDGQSVGQPQNGEKATAQQAAQDPAQGVQTKRILGIIPNFRSVSADTKLPPLSVKEKFIEASQDNFDYSAIFLPALLAGYYDATKATPEFGHGAVAYGRYFWHSLADQSVENYSVEFIFPVLTHEDPRFYTKGHGGFVKRTEYALSRVVITRTDKDTESFNYSEVVGAAFSAGVSQLYYPSGERGAGKAATSYGTSLGIDAATFMFKEFWPDINKMLFKGKQ